MKWSKRQQKQAERQLVIMLTEACETAKAEIPGFSWLTHDNEHQGFPSGLRVTWIFDTQASLDQALARGDDRRMRALTSAALEEAGIATLTGPDILQFDSEESCRDGDWVARLAQLRHTRH